MKRYVLLASALIALALSAASAPAQAPLTVYCSILEEQCRLGVAAFERQTGIKVAMVRKSTGETYAQLKAEAANPRARRLVGRPRRSASAGRRGRAARRIQVADAAASCTTGRMRHAEQARWRTAGIYLGALGIGYNTKVLAERRLPEPKCWADLLDPRFKDEVQVSDPNSSGTAYVLLASLVQLMGEDKAFEYLKSLHRNINQYTKSGAAPVKATALGETAVGIAFMHDMVTMIVDGAP